MNNNFYLTEEHLRLKILMPFLQHKRNVVTLNLVTLNLVMFYRSKSELSDFTFTSLFHDSFFSFFLFVFFIFPIPNLILLVKIWEFHTIVTNTLCTKIDGKFAQTNFHIYADDWKAWQLYKTSSTWQETEHLVSI